MTVIDLRERFGLGWRTPSIPSPRSSAEAAESRPGRELNGRPRATSTWRLALLDTGLALLGVLTGTLLRDGAGTEVGSPSSRCGWSRCAWLVAGAGLRPRSLSRGRSSGPSSHSAPQLPSCPWCSRASTLASW